MTVVLRQDLSRLSRRKGVGETTAMVVIRRWRYNSNDTLSELLVRFSYLKMEQLNCVFDSESRSRSLNTTVLRIRDDY